MKTLCILAVLAFALPSAAATFSTYIGDAYPYSVSALTVDSAGNTFVTGTRQISIPSASISSTDIFVTKVDVSGNVTLLATLAGKGTDQSNAIAVDSSGNIYVAGYTTSPDFPLLRPLQTTPGLYGSTGFLVKLNSSGAMVYSTYLGGTADRSSVAAVAADSAGNAYVTGTTLAKDYPSTPGLPAVTAYDYADGYLSVAFFAKISPAGDKLVYGGGLAAAGHACGVGSSCFTSSIANTGTAIAVDAAGNAYLAGYTYGAGLATTTGALQPAGLGGFVAKINASGTAMGYVTLLGTANYAPPPVSVNSSPATYVSAIAVDSAGDAYIVGSTSDPNFPATASAFQPHPAFPAPTNPYQDPLGDAFVAKLNPTGTAMVWATFLGGTSSDAATELSLDPAGNVWVVGTTASTNFPKASGFPNGTEFLAELSAEGTALLHSQLFPANTIAAGVAVDGGGTVHLAGYTGLVSANAQPSATAVQIFGMSNAAGGILSGRVAAGELISIYGAGLGPATGVSSSFNSAGYLPTSLGGAQVVINGISAPLLYVSSTQINAVAPVELTGTAAISMQVTAGSVALPPFRMAIDAAIPEVFRTAAGNAAAINQDGTINSASNPAKNGSIVAVWASGAGLPLSGADGQETTAAQFQCNCEVWAAGIQGTAAETSSSLPFVSLPYAGSAPGTVTGVVQLNFQVQNSQTYGLLANGKYSDVFQIYVTP